MGLFLSSRDLVKSFSFPLARSFDWATVEGPTPIDSHESGGGGPSIVASAAKTI
jgi:hypothetical protein